MEDRYKLIGPMKTIEALHEELRQYTHPSIRLVGVYTQHTLFTRKWYATLDFVPNLILIGQLEPSYDDESAVFEGYNVDMA